MSEPSTTGGGSEPARLLVVEDDPSIASGLVRGLREHGFDVTLEGTTARAMSAVEREQVDLVVLDLNLPDGSGFDVLENWRFRKSLPVIVLTARTELRARIRAFDLGAADFLAKPFWMEELVARIRTRLRMVDGVERRVVGWDGVACDLDARVVRRDDGVEVNLTAHEFNVLALLVARRGTAFTRDQIAEAALPHEGDRQARTVDSHVSRLRRKLGDAGQRIRTVWGIGYRLDTEDAS